ncbi:MAG: TerB family tellurite resistance protein [Rubrivivax sp.]
MLHGLKRLFESVLIDTPQESPAELELRLQLATAVLLVEVMRADEHIGAAERETVVRVLRQRFDLQDEAVALLIERAQATSRDATDFFAFTTLLNNALAVGQKLQIVEAMWQVAYADGHLETHEQHTLWRVADLLHVPHGAYINAKIRAKSAAGG